MFKKTTFLQKLFARFHLKRKNKENSITETLPNMTTKSNIADGGSDAWNVTLDATPDKTHARTTMVGARKLQHETQPGQDRCA